MGGVRLLGCLAWVWVFLFQAGCGPPESWEGSGPVSREGTLPPFQGLEVAPVRIERGVDQPRPEPPLFQPGFHLALRWSYTAKATTFRLRVPVGRAGERLRLAFRAGDGSLVLKRATVARAGPDGSLASEPLQVTFSGAPGFTVGPRARVVSDPLSFPVDFREELAVSFEVEGALSASAIDLLPGGFARSGAWTSVQGPMGGQAWARPVGLSTIEVEGPPSRAFIALGDSITEGYISGRDDLRNSWASLAEVALGVPVVNGGVSGQGFHGALRYLEAEVLTLSGITDCLVLLGTNDLSALPTDELRARMGRLLTRLGPFCRTWVGTLLPKEKSNHGDYSLVKARRLEMNAWIRTLPDVIDFEAVTRSPEDVHLFLDGLDVDGIHPSREGHRVLSEEAVRVLRAHRAARGRDE
jgi:lysophospholipase L1-like esterase